MLGRTISHYHITSQLGEGGMGIVYEAEDTNLGRHVALKFLTPAMAGDQSLLQRFQREARAASSLNHPNICTIHGIEQFESEHFIVMELLDGESLADRIRRGPDRKSTRLNSSHTVISYAVFCLKKKKT